MSEPIDPINAPLQPAFSPWMRRLDPLLAAEDTNPIFEAFRRRRVRRRWAFDAPPLPWLLARAICCALYVGLSATCFAIPLIFLPVQLARIDFRFGRRGLSTTGVPHRLGAAVGNAGFVERVLVDVWMTGNGTECLLQALYLEHREATGRAWFLAAFGVALAFVGTCAAELAAAGERVIVAAFLLGGAWFCIEAAITAYALAASRSRGHIARSRLVIWSGEHGCWHEIIPGLLLFSMPLVGLALLYALWVYMTTAMSLPAPSPDAPISTQYADRTIVVGTLMLLPCVAFAMRRLRPIVVNRQADATRRELDLAAFSFDVFMAHDVLLDPDGASFAIGQARDRGVILG